MSKEELVAAILKLPQAEQQRVFEDVVDRWEKDDPDMTPELLVKLDRRHQEMLDHPETAMTLEQARAYWVERARPRKGVATS